MRFERAVVVRTCLPLLAAAFLAGCGGGAGEEAKEVAGEPIDTIAVDETDFALDPADITLDEPGTYVFVATNSGNVTHALEIEGNGIEEETEELGSGESAELEVNLDPGAYRLYCPVSNHEDLGMVGTVTVGEV